jgi:hypothetical protein
MLIKPFVWKLFNICIIIRSICFVVSDFQYDALYNMVALAEDATCWISSLEPSSYTITSSGIFFTHANNLISFLLHCKLEFV